LFRILSAHYTSYITDTVWVDGCSKDAGNLEEDIAANSNSGTGANAKYMVVKEVRDKEGAVELVVVEIKAKDLIAKGIFYPKESLKLFWDAFIASLILYTALTQPLQLAFDSYTQGPNGLGLIVFDYVVIGFFFLDMLVTLNTAFYSEKYDAYVTVRRLIFMKYLGNYFFVDLLSSIPLDVLLTVALNAHANPNLYTLQLIKTIRLVRLIKLLKLAEIRKHVNMFIESLHINSAIVAIGSTVFTVAIIGHFLACVWWGVSSSISNEPWYTHAYPEPTNLYLASFREQYLAALYLAVTTVTSTGYGDLGPSNTAEQVMAIFIFIFGAIAYGYVTANVVTIIGNIGRNDARSDKFTHQIREYLDSDEISSTFLCEVIRHAKNVLQRSSVFNEELILGRLPLHLRIGTLLDCAVHFSAVQYTLCFILPFVFHFLFCFSLFFISTFTRSIFTLSINMVLFIFPTHYTTPYSLRPKFYHILHFHSEIFLYENREVLSVLAPFRYMVNSTVKLEILRVMKSSYADKGRCILKEGEQGGGIVFLVSGSAVVSRLKKELKMRIPKKSTLTRCKSSNQLLPKKRLHSGLIGLNREVSSFFKIKRRGSSKDDTSSKDSLKSLFPTVTSSTSAPTTAMKLFEKMSVSDRSLSIKEDNVKNDVKNDVKESEESKGDGRDDDPSGGKVAGGPRSRPLFPRPSYSPGQSCSLDEEIDRRAYILSSCSESMLGSYRPMTHSPPPFTRNADIPTPTDAPAEQNVRSEFPNISSASTSSSLSPFSSEMDVVDNKVKMGTVTEDIAPTSYFADFKSQLSSFNLNIKSRTPFSSDKNKDKDKDKDDKNTVIRPTLSMDDIILNRKKTSNIYRMFGSERKHQGEDRDGRQKMRDDKGKQEVVGVLTRGDFIGYKEMQYSIKHPSSLTAIEACHYYTLDHSDVLTLVRHNPMVAFEFQRALGLAVDEMDDRMRAAQTQQLRGEFFNEIKDQFKKTKTVAIQSKGLAKVLLEYAAKKQKEKDDARARADMSNFDREFFDKSGEKFCRSESYDSQSSSGTKISFLRIPNRGKRRGGTVAGPRLDNEKGNDKATRKKWSRVPFFFRRRSKITTEDYDVPGISSKIMSPLDTSRSGTYKAPNATMSLNKKVAKLNRLHKGLCEMDSGESYRSDLDLSVRGIGGGGGGGGVILESSSKSIESDDSRWQIGYTRRSFISLTSTAKGVLTPEGSQKDTQLPEEKVTYYQALREKLGRRLSLSRRRGSSNDALADSPSAKDSNIDSPGQSPSNTPSRTHSQEEINRNKITRSRSHGRTDGTYGSLKSHRSTADILNSSHEKSITHHRDDIVLHMEDHIPGLRRATSNPNIF
jgi:Ion channel